MSRTSIISAVFLLWAGLAAAQQSSGPQGSSPASGDSAAAPMPVDYTRFIHADHGLTNKKQRLVCADCHLLDYKKDGSNIRPGAVGHQPCIQCHAQQFFVDKPLRICGVCHRSSDYKKKNPADMPFTTTAFRSQFGLAYSHRSHLTPDGHRNGVNKQYPIQLQCEFCHKLAADGIKRELPSHPRCFACHAPANPATEVQLTAAERAFQSKVIVKMDQCQWCHVSPVMEAKVNLFAHRTSSNFRHSAHMEEPDPQHPGLKKKVPCESCHKNQRQVPSIFKITIPHNEN